MKRLQSNSRELIAFACVSVLASSSAMAAGTWSAGTGNWSTGTNWDDSNVPSAVAVTLGDVASGTRTVTYNSANPSVTTLAMTQNTVGATNALAISANLDLTGSGTPFNQTRGAGVAIGGLEVDITGGAVLALTNTNTSKIFSNAGTLNLGNGTTSGTVQMTATGVFSNAGTANFNSGNFLRTGSTTAFTINNGSVTNSLAELNFTGGTNQLGNTTSSDSRSATLDNYGKVSISNGAAVDAYTTTTNGGATANFTLTNRSTGVVQLGSAVTSGTATLTKRSANATGTQNFVVTNDGSISIYGQSYIEQAVTGKGLQITNNGTFNFVGDATGVRVGGTTQVSPTYTNTGTTNVKVFAGAASGLAQVGMLNSDPASTLRGSAAATNSVGGQFNIDSDATLQLVAKRAQQSYLEATFTNSGTLSLGSNASSTTGGLLAFLLTTGTGNSNADDGSKGARFVNGGVANLYGTSSIQMNPASVALIALSNSVPFFVTNNSGAVINMNDASVIGQTGNSSAQGVPLSSNFIDAKPLVTIFSNAGTLNKIGSGTALVQSAAGGTASNTGTIDVQAGSLTFSSSLVNDSTGMIKGNGVLVAPVVTSTGTIAPGSSIGTLGITADLSVGDNGLVSVEVVGDTFDVLNVIGNLDLSSLLDNLTVTASGSQTLTRLPIITYSGSLTGAFSTETLTGFSSSASVDYSVLHEITIVVPEPTSLALMGLAGLGVLRRRR